MNFFFNKVLKPAGIAPSISGVPTISSQTEVGETITATPASVTGSPTPTTSWQWERSSNGATGWADIIGATSSTYTLVPTDDTKYVRAVQTETNVLGSDSANSASSGQVSFYDADAAAYFAAASITDPTEKDAVNQLVLDLKGTGSTTNNNNIWDSMNAIYPVSPTSLAAAAFNLKNPSAFEITWYNSPTHATTGITGGTTKYGDTGYDANSEGMSNNDFGITYSGVYLGGDYAMGVLSAGAYFAIRNASSKKIFYAGGSSTSALGVDTTRSVTTGIRSSNISREIYKNGVSNGTNTTSDTKTLPALTIYVLALDNAGSPAGYFAGEADFWAVHTALTGGEVVDLYDAISTYNANVISGGR